MFVIDLTYIVPLEKLDAHMTEHVKFLKKYYDKNIFVASGRKEEVEKIIQEDPFYSLKLAEFKITEFLTSQYHPDMKKILKK